MALSVHPESQRNEKFKVGFYRYGFNSHQNQQVRLRRIEMLWNDAHSMLNCVYLTLSLSLVPNVVVVCLICVKQNKSLFSRANCDSSTSLCFIWLSRRLSFGKCTRCVPVVVCVCWETDAIIVFVVNMWEFSGILFLDDQVKWRLASDSVRRNRVNLPGLLLWIKSCNIKINVWSKTHVSHRRIAELDIIQINAPPAASWEITRVHLLSTTVLTAVICQKMTLLSLVLSIYAKLLSELPGFPVFAQMTICVMYCHVSEI